MNKESKPSKTEAITKLRLKIRELGDEITILEDRINTLQAKRAEMISLKFINQRRLEELEESA